MAGFRVSGKAGFEESGRAVGISAGVTGAQADKTKKIPKPNQAGFLNFTRNITHLLLMPG